MDIANLTTSILQTVLAAIGLLQNYYIFTHINREYKTKSRDEEQMRTSNYDPYEHELRRMNSHIFAQTRTNSHDIRARRMSDYDSLPRYEWPGRTLSRETTISQSQPWTKMSSRPRSVDDAKPKPPSILAQHGVQPNNASRAQAHFISSPSKALVYSSRQPEMTELEFEDASVEDIQAQ